MSVHSSATCLVSQTRNFDEHANSHSWKLFTSRPKNAGDALASRSRGNKIFSESVCENRIYWFSAAGLHEFRGCRAIFSPFRFIEIIREKVACDIVEWKKKKRKKTETRGKENQVDRWNNSNRRIKRSRDRNCLNALPSFFPPFPLFVFPIFFSFPPPLSSSSSFFLPAIL